MAKKSKKSKLEANEVAVEENVMDAVAGATDALAAFSELGDELPVEFSDVLTEEIIESIASDEESEDIADTEGTELDAFASAEIEDIEEIKDEKVASIVESLLFASDKPQSVALMKAAFSGTKIRSADIRRALEKLQIEYSNPLRGVELYEVAGGYQLRTKTENSTYLQRTIKARPFKLSGPALEVLSIVAYKQPCTKSSVDDIRGVESGHLMRGLLERGLINFGGKSELPGRPMLYETTRKFLETFGLRSLHELPSLNEIDQLIPEGIDETVVEKPKTLSDLTGELSERVGTTYSEGEQELVSISDELQNINLTTAFFEDEKRRQREKRDNERAQEIRERVVIGEDVTERDRRWLERHEAGTEIPDRPVELAEEIAMEALALSAEPSNNSESEPTV